jgi:very-short-patch-repair endonuclease
MGEYKPTKSRVRSLRKRLTPWEARVWLHLRQWRASGLHFRRQVPIGPFIVDFACHRARLVVELDGSGHMRRETALQDHKRDAWLKIQGYAVIRLWNISLDEDFTSCLDMVHRKACERLPR